MKILTIPIAVAAIAWSQYGYAFPAVPFQIKNTVESSDDLIIKDNLTCKSLEWCYHALSQNDEFGVYWEEDYGRIQVYVYTSLPQFTGFKKSVTFRSLDTMNLKNHSSSESLRMKLYLNENFMWVEVYKPGVQIDPVQSTVFFMGLPPSIYQIHRTIASHYLWTNYSDFKSLIQRQYADLYRPDAPGMIEFRPAVKWSARNISSAVY